MQARIASVSAKGQVTIPAEIRKVLGIATPGRVEFVLRDDGVVELRAPAFTLDDVFGSVPPLPGESPDLVREIREAVETVYLERHTSPRYG